MTPFSILSARAAWLDRANIDTDQIIPAGFLRKPRSVGYGQFLFHDLPDARAAVQGASILLAGPNFGCGSSREGAVYALVDAGVRCVLAPSFGDIFFGNAGKNGLLALVQPEDVLARLAAGLSLLTVDLPAQTLTTGTFRVPFDIDPFRKRCLIEGLDDIGLTLAYSDAIEAWQRADTVARPWVIPRPGSSRTD